ALAADGRSASQLRRRVALLLGEPVREPLRISRGALLAGFLVLAVTWGSSALATNAQAPAEKAGDVQTTEPKDKATKSFANGAKVKVLALGTHRDQPQRWWNIAGQPLDAVRFAWKDSNNVASADKKWRRLIFEIQDLPRDAGLHWDVVGSRASARESIGE